MTAYICSSQYILVVPRETQYMPCNVLLFFFVNLNMPPVSYIYTNVIVVLTIMQNY